MINSYHTHTAFCKHAEGSVEDYVKKAIELNLSEIGITDHVPVPDYFYDDEEFKRINLRTKMDYAQIDEYLLEIERAKLKYKDQIKIYSGFECEYYDKLIPVLMELKDKVDYLNFGLHHFYYDGKLNNSFSNLEFIKYYGITACKALDSKLFTIFVHPDLFLYSYRDKPFDKLAEEVTRDMCEAAVRNSVYLEINCNKLRDWLNYGRKFAYPNEDFWKIVSEYKDIKVVIGSDAHKPEYVYDEAVEYAYEWGKKLNLNIVTKIDIK